ncbi:MAG: winged helix-turn-helix domain-containing protein [Candidatus Marinimicrobia bacterium]|nr:winged helix-turn-helix domain-containing protein [Candidatus Neomarinimicrobiota bacterium]
MSKTIRINSNLYNSIRDDSTFEDTPNSVLVRWAKELGRYQEVQEKTVSLASSLKLTDEINIELNRRLELTTERNLRVPVVKALIELGGRARAIDVTEKVIAKLNPSIDDMQKLPSGPRRIEKQIHWARNTLSIKGVILRNSPRGIWELTEYAEEWLEKERRKIENL